MGHGGYQNHPLHGHGMRNHPLFPPLGHYEPIAGGTIDSNRSRQKSIFKENMWQSSIAIACCNRSNLCLWSKPLAHDRMAPRPCACRREVFHTYPCSPSTWRMVGATAHHSTTWSNRLLLHYFGNCLEQPPTFIGRARTLPARFSVRRSRQPTYARAHLPMHMQQPAYTYVSRSHLHAYSAAAGFLGHICLANLTVTSFLGVIGHAARLSRLR